VILIFDPQLESNFQQKNRRGTGQQASHGRSKQRTRRRGEFGASLTQRYRLSARANFTRHLLVRRVVWWSTLAVLPDKTRSGLPRNRRVALSNPSTRARHVNTHAHTRCKLTCRCRLATQSSRRAIKYVNAPQHVNTHAHNTTHKTHTPNKQIRTQRCRFACRRR
jgi:hypothetical protein